MAKGNKVTVMVPAASSSKSARNRRKRQNKKNNRRSIAKSAGRSVRKMPYWPQTKDGATFLRAALDPFSDQTLRSVGVPDAFSGDTLKHTNTMEITVFPTAAGIIEFLIIPSVSDPLIALNGQFQQITYPIRAAVTAEPVGTRTGTITPTGGAVFPAIAWPSWAQYYGQESAGATAGSGYGPYGYKSQRVISMGLEWRYTGTELSDKGVCTAAINDAYCLPGYTDLVTPPAHCASTVRFSARADVYTVGLVNQQNLSNQPQFRQQTMHSAEGAGGMIVLVSGEEGYVMRQSAVNTVLVDTNVHGVDFNTVANQYGIATYGTDDAAAPVTSYFPIQPWQNLRPVGVAFTGLDPAVSITLRLKQRVEATVDPSSAFSQFSDRSPAEDSQALCLVTDISKTLPVMVPVTMNGFGDWWRKIMNTIAGIGKVAGSLGLPFVSPIGGAVGNLADVLGSL